MKNLRSLFIALAAMGFSLYSCSPEPVNPAGRADNEAPTLAGAQEHPALDTVCGFSDPLYMIREDNQSRKVDKCYGLGGIPQPCAPGQPDWGQLILTEGYYNDTNYLDVDFTLAPGWFVDFDNFQFGLESEFNYDQNGQPIIDQDWGTQIVVPSENQWKLRIRVDSLPLPCFFVAIRIHALKLSVFGLPIAGSSTFLWGQNPNWNVPGDPAESESPYLMRFCPEQCMEGPPPPQDTTLTGGNCQGCVSSNTVTFNTANSNCVTVTSCKNLSNVVLRDCNGVNYKFDGLNGKTGTFCHPSGLPVTRVYVKSGCFQSGEGPGYGRRFDNPFTVCP
jgi:hypothetical protein